MKKHSSWAIALPALAVLALPLTLDTVLRKDWQGERGIASEETEAALPATASDDQENLVTQEEVAVTTPETAASPDTASPSEAVGQAGAESVEATVESAEATAESTEAAPTEPAAPAIVDNNPPATPASPDTPEPRCGQAAEESPVATLQRSLGPVVTAVKPPLANPTPATVATTPEPTSTADLTDRQLLERLVQLMEANNAALSGLAAGGFLRDPFQSPSTPGFSPFNYPFAQDDMMRAQIMPFHRQLSLMSGDDMLLRMQQPQVVYNNQTYNTYPQMAPPVSAFGQMSPQQPLMYGQNVGVPAGFYNFGQSELSAGAFL